MAEFVSGVAQHRDADETAIDEAIAAAEYPFTKPRGDLAGLRDQLAETMWNDVGSCVMRAVLRTGSGNSKNMKAP